MVLYVCDDDAKCIYLRFSLCYAPYASYPCCVCVCVYVCVCDSRYLEKVKTLSANGGGIVGELASIGAGGFEIVTLSAGRPRVCVCVCVCVCAHVHVHAHPCAKT